MVVRNFIVEAEGLSGPWRERIEGLRSHIDGMGRNLNRLWRGCVDFDRQRRTAYTLAMTRRHHLRKREWPVQLSVVQQRTRKADIREPNEVRIWVATI